jgi:hypothetical protein
MNKDLRTTFVFLMSGIDDEREYALPGTSMTETATGCPTGLLVYDELDRCDVVR